MKHLLGVLKNSFKCCERFEPRSHFKSRLSLIVWVNELMFKCVPVFLINENLEMFVFENWSTLRKTFWNKGESQQQTQPICKQELTHLQCYHFK